jgi:hypothetical protein
MNNLCVVAVCGLHWKRGSMVTWHCAVPKVHTQPHAHEQRCRAGRTSTSSKSNAASAPQLRCATYRSVHTTAVYSGATAIVRRATSAVSRSSRTATADVCTSGFVPTLPAAFVHLHSNRGLVAFSTRDSGCPLRVIYTRHCTLQLRRATHRSVRRIITTAVCSGSTAIVRRATNISGRSNHHGCIDCELVIWQHRERC